uniref:AB hydrolase-1 domain-containing protein n=1 Tax=Angiostrongylus cantonensis TaxID=6313 RepID=A0A0K0DJV8_ANGCA
MLDGRFRSPHAIMFPNQLPGCLQWARWRAYLPNTARKGVCIHLAGTGDHSYIRRELGFVKGLLEEGIGSVLVQNPFYADRKPMSQFRSSLENVSDLFVMGAALISECNYLISWAISEGYGPVALSGVSMGGFMASLAATNVCIPIGVVPCMSWTTAAPAFTEGALRDAINYGQLQQQLEDRLYVDKLRSIPNVNWVDEMYERNKMNGLGLAHNMMCILMNEFTCLANYPAPLDTSLCTAIVAEHDAYVLRPNGALDFTQIWPGMRVIKMERMGHVTAYLNGHHLFRTTIAQTLRHMGENFLGE